VQNVLIGKLREKKHLHGQTVVDVFRGIKTPKTTIGEY